MSLKNLVSEVIVSTSSKLKLSSYTQGMCWLRAYTVMWGFAKQLICSWKNIIAKMLKMNKLMIYIS